MRPIKFRAFHKELKVMREVLNLNIAFNEVRVADYHDNVWFEDTFELMQFTGLHDKNDNPIFEGDIVRYFIPIPHIPRSSFKDGHIVKFKRGRFGILPIHPHYLHPDDRKFQSLFTIRKEYLEIEGNIHENGELLCDQNQ
jgi:uncharacterized phage protein (TIGR01671 family)